jgi:hypothetical protein
MKRESFLEGIMRRRVVSSAAVAILCICLLLWHGRAFHLPSYHFPRFYTSTRVSSACGVYGPTEIMRRLAWNEGGN